MSAVPAYLERGAGEALLFLHGIGGGKECWGPQLEAFADGYRAVAWDMPGYGETPALAEPSFAALAEALRALVGHLGGGPVHLVGHSLGGMVAQEFAARHPERLRSLVLSGTSPAFGRAHGDWQKKFIAARLGPLDAGHTMAELAAGIVAGLLGEAPDPAGVVLAVDCMSRVPPETYRAMMRLLVTFDRREALARIAVPTLVLAGERDDNAAPKVMAGMAERIPGARYACLAGAGHIANLEQPAAFNASVRTFLDELGAGAQAGARAVT